MGKLKTALAVLGLFFVFDVNAAEYLIKYKNENAVSKMMKSGLSIKDFHAPGKLLKVDLTEGSKSMMMADENIEYIVPNYDLKAVSAAIDLKTLKKQYALKKINMEKAWLRAGNKGNRRVLVAVIDTGVDYNHKNLSNNMVSGYDFFSNDSDPMDETMMDYNKGHGTHCSGILGANGLVDKGIVGISPEVSIMPLRFLGPRNSGSLVNAIKAIDYAIARKVQVISASWSAPVTPADARPLVEAIQRAEAAGIIFVAAAANDSHNNDKNNSYPANANLPNMITVAASTESDRRASYSNYGKANVSLAAPGDQIVSTLPKNNYSELSGTSMAAPLVAGLVAFLKAQDPSLTGAQVKALLQTTGTKVSIETACKCRVDAFASVDALLTKKPWLVPAAGTLKVGSSLKFAMKNNNGFVKYTVSDIKKASVDEKTGILTALEKGTVKVTGTDSVGQVANSVEIYIIK